MQASLAVSAPPRLHFGCRLHLGCTSAVPRLCLGCTSALLPSRPGGRQRAARPNFESARGGEPSGAGRHPARRVQRAALAGRDERAGRLRAAGRGRGSRRRVPRAADGGAFASTGPARNLLGSVLCRCDRRLSSRCLSARTSPPRRPSCGWSREPYLGCISAASRLHLGCISAGGRAALRLPHGPRHCRRVDLHGAAHVERVALRVHRRGGAAHGACAGCSLARRRGGATLHGPTGEQVRQAFLDGSGRLDRARAHVPYDEAEARQAFARVAAQHGWRP